MRTSILLLDLFCRQKRLLGPGTQNSDAQPPASSEVAITRIESLKWLRTTAVSQVPGGYDYSGSNEGFRWKREELEEKKPSLGQNCSIAQGCHKLNASEAQIDFCKSLREFPHFGKPFVRHCKEE